MLYIALIPTSAWVALCVATWAACVFQTWFSARMRGPWLRAWLGVMAVQAMVASVTAVATRIDPIDYFPCRMGAYGSLVTLTVSLIGGLVLALLIRDWPRSAEGKREGSGRAIAAWIAFGVVTFLAHIRSAALCTV